MTGELADCFRTKEEGVDRILAAVEAVTNGAESIGVWQTSGEFVTTDVAREFWMLTAAANWHALATFAGRVAADGVSLLIDLGSTTTDIIPIIDGLPMPEGRTDCERLLSSELVYTGVRRTPVAAITRRVPAFDSHISLAAELFATMHDVYLVLGDIAADETNTDTADGRTATRDAAFDRLARMLCCDRTEVTVDELARIAQFVADVQLHQIRGALDMVLQRFDAPPATIVISGEGEFLARRVLAGHPRCVDASVVSLSESLGASASTAACAFALAKLGQERM